jgi:hypothetical protein
MKMTDCFAKIGRKKNKKWYERNNNISFLITENEILLIIPNSNFFQPDILLSFRKNSFKFISPNETELLYKLQKLEQKKEVLKE